MRRYTVDNLQARHDAIVAAYDALARERLEAERQRRRCPRCGWKQHAGPCYPWPDATVSA